MYDEARDKVTRWLVKASTLQRDSDWVELCDRVRRWPELNPLNQQAQAARAGVLQGHRTAVGRGETGGRGELV